MSTQTKRESRKRLKSGSIIKVGGNEEKGETKRNHTVIMKASESETWEG